MCRIATGGAISRRTLHVNDEETIFTAKRPALLNGIDQTSIERPDLQDRTLRIELLPIAERNRRTERDVEESFIQDYPFILGAMCDAVQSALGRYETWAKRIGTQLPRMADFTLWACAGLDGIGFDAERLLEHYRNTKHRLLEDAVESNIVTETLVRFMQERRATTGATDYRATPTELLNALTNFIEKSGNRVPKHFPRGGQPLSRQIERLQEALKSKGVFCEKQRTSGNRTWLFEWNKEAATSTATVSMDNQDASPF